MQHHKNCAHETDRSEVYVWKISSKATRGEGCMRNRNPATVASGDPKHAAVATLRSARFGCCRMAQIRSLERKLWCIWLAKSSKSAPCYSKIPAFLSFTFFSFEFIRFRLVPLIRLLNFSSDSVSTHFNPQYGKVPIL